MGGLRGYLDPSASTPEEAARLQAQVDPGSEFERGMAANQIQSQAGDLYSQSLDAELNKDLGAASALRAKAANVMSLSPKLQSREEGMGGYAAGVLGQMAPDLPKFAAAGLLGRGIGALGGVARAGELAGAAIPGYGMSRRAAITAQEQDPGAMQASPEARSAAATREGLLGGALGAIPVSHALQSATKPGLRGLFQGAALTGAENAGISAAQTAYGQHEMNALNPQRDQSQDMDAIGESALSGGIGGLGMHAAFAVPGLPLRAVNEVANLAGKTPAAMAALREAAGPAVDRAQDLGGQAADATRGAFGAAADAAAPAVDAVRGAADSVGSALKDRFGDQANDAVDAAKGFVGRASAAVQDAAGRVPDAIRNADSPSDFLSRVVPNLKKTPETPDEEINTHFPPTAEDELGAPPAEATPFSAAGKTAAEVFDHLKSVGKDTGEKAKAYFQAAAQKLGGTGYDPTTPEGQKAIGEALSAKTADLGNKVKDFVQAFKDKGIKSSEMGDQTKPDLERLVFDHLTDQARKDPQIVDNLPDVVEALQHAATTGDRNGLQGYKRIASVFKDPQAFEREFGAQSKSGTTLMSAARSAASAADDAGKPNSFLNASLNPAHKLQPGQIHQIGDLVDRLPGMSKKEYLQQGAKLVSVFGSKEKAQRVIDYYRNDFTAKTKNAERTPGEAVHENPETPEHTLVDQDTLDTKSSAPPNYDEGQNEYIFKDHKAARPFFAGEDTSTATAKARAESGKVDSVNYLDFVHEHGLDPDHEATRLVGDAARRLAKIQKQGTEAKPGTPVYQELRSRYARLKPQVDQMNKIMNADHPVRVEGHGVVKPGVEGVLQLHTVLATEPKSRESRIDATQTDMGKYGPKRGGDAATIRDTLINAHLKDPVTGTIKPRTFSLEAMARAEAKASGGEFDHLGLSGGFKAAAARGLAKIMARPDFVKFEKSERGRELNDLVVHRATNTKLDLSERAVKAGAKWTDEQVAEIERGKEGLRATIDKYKASDQTERSILQNKLEKRVNQLRGEAEGAGPSGVYAKRRADLIQDALDKMEKVRLNEMKDAAKEKITDELKLTDDAGVTKLADEAKSLRDIEASSRAKMAKLSGSQNDTRTAVTRGEAIKEMKRRAEYEKSGADRQESVRVMSDNVPRDKRDEFNYHKSRYFAARELANDRERMHDLAMRDAEKASSDGEMAGMMSEDDAARKFASDFEMYGRAGAEGELSKQPLRLAQKRANLAETRPDLARWKPSDGSVVDRPTAWVDKIPTEAKEKVTETDRVQQLEEKAGLTPADYKALDEGKNVKTPYGIFSQEATDGSGGTEIVVHVTHQLRKNPAEMHRESTRPGSVVGPVRESNTSRSTKQPGRPYPEYAGQQDIEHSAKTLMTVDRLDRRKKVKVGEGPTQKVNPERKISESPAEAAARMEDEKRGQELMGREAKLQKPIERLTLKEATAALEDREQFHYYNDEAMYDPTVQKLKARIAELKGLPAPEIPTPPDLNRDRTENPSRAKDGASDERESNYYAQAGGPPEKLDPVLAKRIRDEFINTVGPHVELRFEQALGGKAGTYTPSTEKTHAIVRAVIGSAAQMQGTVWHESMHHLFREMGDKIRSPEARAAYRDMKEVAMSPQMQRQLREILKDYPKALDQLHDPDEALAYAYQFWRQGEIDGKPMINLGSNAAPWFAKIRDFLFNALGVISKTGKVEKIFAAFSDGHFSQPDDIDAAIRDLHANTLRDRIDHVAPGVGKAFDALILGATDRLRSYGYNSLDKIADLMHKDPSRESGKLGFLQRRGQVNGIEMNRYQEAIGNPTHVELKTALNNLQSMKKPSTPLEKKIRGTLDHLFKYMDDAGVKMKDDNDQWQSVSQRYVGDYFPRVWDRQAIDGDRAGMRKLLMTEGYLSRTEADAAIDSMTGGDGLLDLAENEHHLGFSPGNRALTTRKLNFIKAKNADKFVKYQSQDLNEIMSKYIYQATHRAEYARSFGNDGAVIRSAFEQARREGASAEDLASAHKAVMAMEGTLGHDFNPQLRKLFTGLTAYQNIVLLPFALLSSVSDVSGVALRSNQFGESFRAMQLGARGIARQLMGTDESGDTLLKRAKDYGIVDSLNMLENYGNIYNSSFMSPTLRKVNDKFFKYNGMEMWNRQMRLAGFEAGQRFLLRSKADPVHGTRYMQELGLKAEDMQHIKANQDGGIDLDNLPPATQARMQGALYRFVDGAVLRPNAAQRPVWASDPAWMLVAHLKQFAFSFQNTFIKRLTNEAGHGNSKALITFASFLPFGIFSGAVRRAMAGQAALGGMDALGIVNDGAMRSGMAGTGMFLEDAVGDVHRGKLPGTSFLGPTAEHAQKVLEFATGGPETASQLALRSTPLSPLVKDFSPMPD